MDGQTAGESLKDSADGKRARGTWDDRSHSRSSVSAQFKQGLGERNKVVVGCEGICGKPAVILNLCA